MSEVTRRSKNPERDIEKEGVELKIGSKATILPGSEPEKVVKRNVSAKKKIRAKIEELPDSNNKRKSTESVKQWMDESTQSSDNDELMELSKSELIELIKNPLGMLVVNNDKDADFIHSYMKLGHVKEALLDCEYAPPEILKDKTALTTLAKEMMARTEIQAAISWCKNQRLDDLIISREEFADYLTQIARGSISDLVNDDGMLEPSKIKKHGRCIDSYRSTISKNGNITISVKMRSPLAAAQELAKYEDWESQDKNKANMTGNLANDALDAIKADIIDVEVQE